MGGFDNEKYHVLKTGVSNPTYSIIEVIDEDPELNRRRKLVTYIPDAGTEMNAIRVARLLNVEVMKNLEIRAKRDQELQPRG